MSIVDGILRTTHDDAVYLDAHEIDMTEHGLDMTSISSAGYFHTP